ncbi:MAG: hypothetical protein RLZZ135_1235, partial [Cyanobacteriota bacterium]
CQCDRWHPQFYRSIDQIGQLTRTVKQAVVTVDVQTNERHRAIFNLVATAIL